MWLVSVLIITLLPPRFSLRPFHSDPLSPDPLRSPTGTHRDPDCTRDVTLLGGRGAAGLRVIRGDVHILAVSAAAVLLPVAVRNVGGAGPSGVRTDGPGPGRAPRWSRCLSRVDEHSDAALHRMPSFATDVM
ncbi:unnamed protein product [Merluccius merluccius]